MKVELVKVKINKLKEVKKQLRKRKPSTKKNLKNLLLDNEERENENDIFYQSINALFQDDKSFNETVCTSGYSDSHSTDYHVDLDDLLESLSACRRDVSNESLSDNLLLMEPNSHTEECLNFIEENHRINNFNYLVYNDNNDDKQQEGGIYFCDDVEKESITFYNSNEENIDSTTNINVTKLEPGMAELGNYYIPDKVFETTDETIIDMDDLCNQIGITISEEPDRDDIYEQVEHGEISYSIVPDSASIQFEEESNNYSESDVIQNAVRGLVMINPLLINNPAIDLQDMALYQLQQLNDSVEISNVGESEILKDCSFHQKAHVIAAAKLLYTKRTRTLLHWLDPDLSLTKMRSTLELSWQNLPLWQKEVYFSQVMGPLMLETVSPMINPHLKPGGPKISRPKSPKKSQSERKRFSDLIKELQK